MLSFFAITILLIANTNAIDPDFEVDLKYNVDSGLLHTKSSIDTDVETKLIVDN